MNPASTHIGVPPGSLYHASELTWAKEAAWHLVMLMSECSEDAYCASWHLGAEYDIWDVGIGEQDGTDRPHTFGWHTATCRSLVGYGKAIGCWWFCVGHLVENPDGPLRDAWGRRPVTIATWEKMRAVQACMQRVTPRRRAA